jgi:spore coat protein U-like protein
VKPRTVAVGLAGLALALAPVAVTALPASAASRPAAAPATLVSTTTLLKATQVTGTTPGKVVFGIQVKVFAGVIAQGSITLTVDNGTPVTLTLKANGRTSYTHHYKPGTHTAVASYLGSTTDAASSSGTVTFTVS